MSRWERVNSFPFLGNPNEGLSPHFMSGLGVSVFMPTTSVHIRGPDLLAYLYLMATCQVEYHFSACLAYDMAFRKKASKFHLST